MPQDAIPFTAYRCPACGHIGGWAHATCPDLYCTCEREAFECWLVPKTEEVCPGLEPQDAAQGLSS